MKKGKNLHARSRAFHVYFRVARILPSTFIFTLFLSIQASAANVPGFNISTATKNTHYRNAESNGITDWFYQAQDITVSGRVTSLANDPMPGVSVSIKGTQTGTTTDASGAYRLTVPNENVILVFSYVGFETQEVSVAGKTSIDVTLVASTRVMDQVVVIGYGTTRKRDLTGSISKVAGPELSKQPVQTPTQALQGKVSGVQIIGSGRPNSQPQVRIRGTGSALAGVNPLYVVDGVLTDDIRNINNYDIVSVEVLKDASAGIYGVRAANGVIIITTKKGRSGATQISYDANVGFREASNLVDMADRNQYIAYLKDAAPTQNVNNPPLTYDGTTNWYDEVLRKALWTNHNISVSGGSERNTFFFSGGYISEEGIVTTNNFKRFTFRANNDLTLSPKFKLGIQIAYSRANERAVELEDTYRSVYRAAPIVPAVSGSKYGNLSAYGNVGNPVLSIDKRDQKIVNSRLFGNFSLEYTPVKWLKLRSAINTDLVFTNDRTYTYQFQNDTTTYLTAGGNQRRLNSGLSVTDNRSYRYIWDNTITFDKKFEEHSVTFLIGSVTEKFQSDFLSGSRINVPANSDQWYLNLGNPDQQLTNNAGGDLQTRQSFVGRLSYGFDSKYLVSASLRRDGSSKFKEKYGYFPTVGVGWVISEESFMQNQEIFDFLKFRASWGKVGNDAIESNAYILTAAINIPYFFNNALTLGTVIQDIKNQNLKWESGEQIDIGFEFSMLGKRLSGEADYYKKKTNDALAFQIIPAIFGDPDNQFLTNIASFENKGFEFSLNWKDNIGSDISYEIGGNITFNQNELVGLGGGQALLGGSVGQQGLVTRSDNGQPVGSFYVLKAIGIFQNQAEIDASPVFGTRANVRPGDLKYEDQNKDNVIDLANDRVYAGSYQPEVYYGFNLGFNYKNVDLSADFYGNAGNKIYNGKRAFRFENTDNIEADYADARWTTSNASQTDPRIITSATPASTYFIESGDFFRLNNLTIGYKLPASFLQKARISNFRLFLTSQNLFTAKQFSGFSPELLGGPLDSGIELNAYPTTRTFAVGLNLGF